MCLVEFFQCVFIIFSLSIRHRGLKGDEERKRTVAPRSHSHTKPFQSAVFPWLTLRISMAGRTGRHLRCSRILKGNRQRCTEWCEKWSAHRRAGCFHRPSAPWPACLARLLCGEATACDFILIHSKTKLNLNLWHNERKGGVTINDKNHSTVEMNSESIPDQLWLKKLPD